MEFESLIYISSGKFTSRETWIHPSRVLDSGEIIYVTDGEVFIAEDDVNYHLKAGDILILNAGKHHYGYMQSEKTVSFYWVHFKCEEQNEINLKYLMLGNLYHINILFRQLLQSSNSPEYPGFCSDYYIRLIMVELSINSVGESKSNLPLIHNIEEWME